MPWYKFRPGSADSLSLNQVTTGTGTAIAFNDCRQVSWLVTGSGTISSGTVLIESADSLTYSGTWNQLDSIDASTLTGGATTGNTFPMPPGGFVRGRISANIVGGGNVTVALNGLLT